MRNIFRTHGLWSFRFCGDFKIMAGKKPARGCCVVSVVVPCLLAGTARRVDYEKHPSLKEEKWQ